MVNVSEVLWDENGNFLGRDLKSWAKILGFYAIYYTFLGFLFYGFTVTYYLESKVLSGNPVGGKPAVANARLDMPGAVVHPFREMMDARGDVNRMTMDEKTRGEYCAKLGLFFQAKDTLNESSKDCKEAGVTTKDATCKVSTEGLGQAECISNMNQTKPMITIDINKIIGWTPSDVGIHFQCYEYNKKTTEKLATQEYEVHWLSEKSIASYYFPYHGVSSAQLIQLPAGQNKVGDDALEQCGTPKCLGNKPFNKPFVAGVVQNITGETGLDDKEHMFRCDILSDKITRQQYGTSEEDKNTDAELRGLGLGFVEFGFQFEKPKN